ncbi:agmatine deiminase [Anaerosporobacter faecicola]|uniref:agmatine deiminase n=1 Tax=Anaerosporobacter faecicola TaxID=2718714 RepID=UPI00143B71D4|nr:agmatine deiminase [Anaerosporobacter faecicola]
MRILKTTPREDGFHMPAEYEQHQGCYMIWPERADSWQFGGIAAKKEFVEVAKAIQSSEQVTMLVSEKEYDTARRMLPEEIRVVEMSTDDAWVRDCGPTFVVNEKKELRGIDWYFNAWGGLEDGLYFPWDKDNKVARKICDLEQKDVYNARHFVLEGGSIHVDGEGTAMVTEACLLSKGRNPDMTKQEIEEQLKAYLSVEKVIWLKNGIYLDETNEHIDNICAFVKPAEVVLAWTEDTNDPQYALSSSCLEILERERDAKGRKITVHKLPLPKPIHMTEEDCEGIAWCEDEPTREAGERLAASYVNFYIGNTCVVMPGFEDPMDEVAREVLVNLFPERRVLQVPTRNILIGGGNIHCITQQVPAGRTTV